MKILTSLCLAAVALSTFSFVSPPPVKHAKLQRLASAREENLILYYSPSCPYSQRVLNYMHSIHKTVMLKDVSANPNYKQELISIGGRAQVPCLVIDGKAMYESSMIIEWMSQHQNEMQNETSSPLASRARNHRIGRK